MNHPHVLISGRHCAAILRRLSHTLSLTHYPPKPPPPSQAEIAKQVSEQTLNSPSLNHLNQLFTHILRTHFLFINPAPFYYNNIVRSFTRLRAPKKALFLYIYMLRNGVATDTYTLPVVLKAASQVFDRKLGGQLHSVGVKFGVEKNMYCESGFISLYFKYGEFLNARKVFDENCERELGSWNAILAGLAQGGRGNEAIGMFVGLKREGFVPNDVTMVSATSACGSLGDLNLAVQLHRCVFEAMGSGRTDMLMMNSLIDMYGKCGRMDLAYRVFWEMEERNVSSWTSMIVGYAMHGHVRDVLECFRCMREAGVVPNYVTFVGVLSACVHGGLMQDGKYYFNMMKNDYGIMPMMQHYGCMADLLGRAGLFEEAREMIENMPIEANVIVWGSLMGGCEKHGNVEMGEWVAKHLIELEPWNDGVFVVLSNIYASNCMWEEVERIRVLMKARQLAKIPGYSFSTTNTN